jgi:hypothetical protein
MEKRQSEPAYTLLLAASLARDLEAAGLLSGTSRKLIHDGLAELRSELESVTGASPAITILENITPAGSD